MKLGEKLLAFEEDLLNYSMYIKNMPQQTQLMEEAGNEFFAVSTAVAILQIHYSIYGSKVTLLLAVLTKTTNPIIVITKLDHVFSSPTECV